MKIIGVVYRDETSDIQKYENFLTEISKFDILGEPIFFKGEYLLYRALIKIKNSLDKSKVDSLIEKYKVKVC